jgi:hypothetical protein
MIILIQGWDTEKIPGSFKGKYYAIWLLGVLFTFSELLFSMPTPGL